MGRHIVGSVVSAMCVFVCVQCASCSCSCSCSHIWFSHSDSMRIDSRRTAFILNRARRDLTWNCNSYIAFLGLKCWINWTFCENIEARNIDESSTMRMNEWTNAPVDMLFILPLCMPMLCDSYRTNKIFHIFTIYSTQIVSIHFICLFVSHSVLISQPSPSARLLACLQIHIFNL